MQFINLQAQYATLKTNINHRIQAVLEHGKYILGPEVAELEQKLAAYVGVEHCITCANGTDAIQLSLMALDIGPGDAVIVPSFTFFASAEAVSITGAEPYFTDIDPVTFNLCPIKLEETILEFHKRGNAKLKAVLAVDLFGLPANYSQIEAVCEKYDLQLIEDGAQGFGGTFEGKKACSFGHIATTSFFPAKPLGCYGDGGAIFTNDRNIASKIKSLRMHGKGDNKYDNVRIGINSRLDTIQAAILLEKLSIFDTELSARDHAAELYQELIKLDVTLPKVSPLFTSSWAQYTITFNSASERNKAQEALEQASIPYAIYYPVPLHQSPIYKTQNHYSDCTNSERASERVLSLPISPYISDHEIREVADVLNSITTN